jgi:hypothetical protein
VGAVRSALDWIAAQGAHGNAEPVMISGWSTGHRQPRLRAIEGLNLVFCIPERCRAGWKAPSSGTNQENVETHRAVFGDWWRMDLPAKSPIHPPCGEA